MGGCWRRGRQGGVVSNPNLSESSCAAWVGEWSYVTVGDVQNEIQTQEKFRISGTMVWIDEKQTAKSARMLKPMGAQTLACPHCRSELVITTCILFYGFAK